MISLIFLTTSLIVILIPGTGAIYTMSNGLMYGKKQSLCAALGSTLGILPHLLLSILSLSLFKGINEQVLLTVKVIGSLYLLYMGIHIFTSKPVQVNNSNTPYQTLPKIIITGISINLLNPKLTIFFLAFIPQFIKPLSYNIIIQAIILGFLFMIMTLGVFIIYGLLASFLKKALDHNSKALILTQKVFGIIFIFFALQLGLSRL